MKGDSSLFLSAPVNSGYLIFTSIKASQKLYKKLWTIYLFLYNKHT